MVIVSDKKDKFYPIGFEVIFQKYCIKVRYEKYLDDAISKYS